MDLYFTQLAKWLIKYYQRLQLIYCFYFDLVLFFYFRALCSPILLLKRPLPIMVIVLVGMLLWKSHGNRTSVLYVTKDFKRCRN